MNADKPQAVNFPLRQDALIAETYTQSRDAVRGYIYKRIGSYADAEDLTQDLFVRLLNCNTLLNEQTVLHFIYTVARNLIVDYLRRHARSRAASEYFSVYTSRTSRDTEERIAAGEVQTLETECLLRMPQRKAQIYRLCVQQDYSAERVAAELALSRRTVENHLFAARQQMRHAISACL